MRIPNAERKSVDGTWRFVRNLVEEETTLQCGAECIMVHDMFRDTAAWNHEIRVVAWKQASQGQAASVAVLVLPAEAAAGSESDASGSVVGGAPPARRRRLR